MTLHPRLIRASAVILLVILSQACVIPSLVAPSSTAPAGPAGRGSGSQDLSNPAQGLDGLQAYQAVLKISFSGSQGGKQTQWSESYTLVVNTADGTRLLNIADSGLPQDASMDGWVFGSYNHMVINQGGSNGACSVVKSSGSDQPNLPDPAAMLPPVLGAQTAVPTGDIAGLAVNHFSFDQRAIAFPGQGQATGEMWLAETGGYLVKYSLSAKGGSDFFGQDMQGTMTWDYQLSDVNGAPQAALPDDCPPGVIDAPPTDDAQIITDRPGVLEFTTNESVKDVAGFYQDKLPPLGYIPASDPYLSTAFAWLSYKKSGLVLNIRAAQESNNPVHVLIVLERENPASAPGTTPEAGPTPTSSTPASSDLSTRLSQALMALIGSSSKPSVLPSYHLDISENVPSFDQGSGSVKVSAVLINADVQGSNVYFKEMNNNQLVIEGYLIDGKEYTLTNGTVQPGQGLLQMDWAAWPLDIIMPFTIASLGATPQGTVSLDNRSADSVGLDSSKADPATLAMLQSMGLLNSTVQSASGTVWLDEASGAMLKLVMDYTLEFKDTQSGQSAGTGQGHIDLAVSKVGQVEVKLP